MANWDTGILGVVRVICEQDNIDLFAVKAASTKSLCNLLRSAYYQKYHRALSETEKQQRSIESFKDSVLVVKYVEF